MTWEYTTSSPPTKPWDQPDQQSQSSPWRKSFGFRPSHRLAQASSAALSAAGGEQTSVYWPADLLPNTLPNCRIWTYGYNADIISGLFGKNNQNSLLKHANDFMVKLERTLRDDQPVIFVAHSLGGIIVKRALSQMESSFDNGYVRLFRRVSAVVFCGCPHRGSDTASWGLLASNLVAVAMTDANSKLLSELEVDSEILDLIQDAFLITLRKAHSDPSNSTIRIHSFLEGKPVTGVRGLNRKIVNDFSSKLGWSDEKFETIDADHCEMVGDAGVKDISSVLLDLENLTKNLSQRKPYEHLDMFRTTDYRAILNEVPKRTPNTCSWILDTEAFKGWSRGEGSGVFWLYGNPGQGKSVLAKYLVEEVLGTDRRDPNLVGNIHSHNPTVVFFFCSYRDNRTQTLRSLLSSFLHQLLSQKPELGDTIRRRHETLSLPPEEALYNLWSMLEDAIYYIPNFSKLSSATGPIVVPPPKNLYFIVDALDELTRSDWVPFLEQLFGLLKRRHHSFRFILTSRNEPDIERQMRAADAWRLDLNSTRENRSDLAEHIRATVSTFGEENGFDDGITRTIISELVTRAGAMFLWASLAWSFFTEGVGIWTRKLVQQQLQVLKRLPPGMEGLYYRILAKVDRKDQADLLHLLQLLVAAARPLKVNEFAVALALRERPRAKRDLDVRLNIKTFLRRACPHLINISEFEYITLVHLSCKEYLLGIPLINGAPNPFHIDLAAANLEIGLDCLSYIALDDFADDIGWKSLRVYHPSPFFDYGVHYWLYHLRGMNDRVREIWPYFARFYLAYRRFDLEFHRDIVINLWTHGLHHLFEPAAAMFQTTWERQGLNVTNEKGDHFIHTIVPNIRKFPLEDAEFLTGLGLDINGGTHLGQTLLHRCVAEWQDERGALLLSVERRGDIDCERDNGGDTRVGPGPLSEGTLHNLLSFRGIDPNAMDKFGYTPLSFAIHEGLDKIVEIILSLPNLDTAEAFTALHIAAKEGVLWATECLLSRGVPTWKKTKYGETALHVAASKGHLRVLKLLASKSQPHVLNAKDNHGWTVSHHAVTSGNEQMIIWLIAHTKVDLDLRDKHGRRAVAFAAAYGTETMLKGILHHRPRDLAHLDSFGNTLFHMASSGGNLQNISFLHKLQRLGRIARPSPNRWGKTVTDLASTSKMETYLSGLGYNHSPRYLMHRQKTLMDNLQALARAASLPSAGMTDVATIQKDSSKQSEDIDLFESYSDNLGREMNTIYAIDPP